MPGRDPKPTEQRRRRNRLAGVAKLSKAENPEARPDLPNAGKRLKATRDWWDTVWASPMAGLWMASDVPALVRLAGLVELSVRGEASAAILSEIRQLEDRFGLSPLARRRLSWEIERVAGGQTPASSESQDDRWLRAVSD